MPKKASFNRTYPPLRKPINSNNIQKKKNHVTLRERPFSSVPNTIVPLKTVATPNISNINFIKIQEDTAPKYISSLGKVSQPILQPIICNTLDNNSMDHLNNRNNFIRTSESTE